MEQRPLGKRTAVRLMERRPHGKRTVDRPMERRPLGKRMAAKLMELRHPVKHMAVRLMKLGPLEAKRMVVNPMAGRPTKEQPQQQIPTACKVASESSSLQADLWIDVLVKLCMTLLKSYSCELW